MDISLGTLLRFWGVLPIHTGPTPPVTPQTMLDACIQIFFSEFQLGMEGELQENFENDALFLAGTEKWQKNMNIAVLT